jgi:hypothetical protein
MGQRKRAQLGGENFCAAFELKKLKFRIVGVYHRIGRNDMEPGMSLPAQSHCPSKHPREKKTQEQAEWGVVQGLERSIIGSEVAVQKKTSCGVVGDKQSR